MTFFWLSSQVSVKENHKKVNKSHWLYTDFLWLFLDFEVRKSYTKLLSHITQSHDQNTEYIFVQKTPPTTNSLEKELMVVDKMTKAALSSLGMEFGIVVKKRLAWFNWGNGKKKKKKNSIDNGLKILLGGGLLCLRCLHDGLDDVYKL